MMMMKKKNKDSTSGASLNTERIRRIINYWGDKWGPLELDCDSLLLSFGCKG